jgi:hypothetical protein
MNDKSTKSEEIFQPVTLPRKEMSSGIQDYYRVYSEAGKYVLVAAQSARDAFKASGMATALRIERDALFFQNVMKKDASPVAGEAVAADVPVAVVDIVDAAPAEAEKAIPAPPSDAPLSDEEVSKLLEG